MKNLHIIFGVIIILGLGGCSSKYAVTFDSNPQGASLICNGKNWGYTPMTLYYDKSVKQSPSLNLGSCSANWVSGARQNYGVVPVAQYPDGVRQTLPRPNIEGYPLDAEFALKVQNMKYQKRQAEAAENAASAARDSANSAQRQNNKTTTCYTNYGVTTCY